MEKFDADRVLDGNDPVMPRSERGRSQRRGDAAITVGAGTLIVTVAALLWMLREAPAAKPNPSIVATDIGPSAAEEQRVHEPAAVVEPAATSDDIPVMAAGSHDDSKGGPRHPHPITPLHERNFKQLNRIAQLNSAVDLGDASELRQLNQTYREEYPEASLYQDGYDLIADCLESRTAQARARAQHYWDTQVASNLRRYIRRYCLE